MLGESKSDLRKDLEKLRLLENKLDRDPENNEIRSELMNFLLDNAEMWLDRALAAEDTLEDLEDGYLTEDFFNDLEDEEVFMSYPPDDFEDKDY